jgi:prepilin signal peptidase PulO-like enzyme (type II secretory pathway)
MVASIIQNQSSLNFRMNRILICYCHSQIFELYPIFKGSISYLYIMILPYILVRRHDSDELVDTVIVRVASFEICSMARNNQHRNKVFQFYGVLVMRVLSFWTLSYNVLK